MKKPAQHKFYYFLFAVCLIGGFTTPKSFLAFWIILFILLFFFYLRSRTLDNKLKIEKQKKDALQNAYVKEYKQVYARYLKEPDPLLLAEEELEKLTNSYNLDKAASTAIKEAARRALENDLISDSLSDGVLSPANYELIFSTAEKLELTMELTPETRCDLDKMMKFWKIENEPLQPVSVQISLAQGEVCYFMNPCRWNELRSSTDAISYTGLTGSFALAKGIRYRMGAFAPKRIVSESLSEIDTGTIYLTNHRLIFTGLKKNTHINLVNILSFVPYLDAIEIGKDAGKSPVLVCEDSDIMAHLLTRLKAGTNY